MRTFLIATLLALATTTACKDKPKRKAPPVNPSAPSAKAAAPGAAAPDLELPHSEGGPPVKTTRPLTRADFERLGKLQYPGFNTDVRNMTDKAIEIRQVTNGHPRYWATVTIQNCFDCVPMEIEKWKAKADDLKALLGPLKDTPGVTFEMGTTNIGGQTVIWTYQFGEGTSKGDEGGAHKHFTNALALYYNDGINQMRVVAEYKDDPKPLATLKKLAPKEHLQMLALAFMDVYSHEWATK